MGRRKLIGDASALALVAGLAVVGACGVDTTAAEFRAGKRHSIDRRDRRRRIEDDSPASRSR